MKKKHLEVLSEQSIRTAAHQTSALLSRYQSDDHPIERMQDNIKTTYALLDDLTKANELHAEGAYTKCIELASSITDRAREVARPGNVLSAPEGDDD